MSSIREALESAMSQESEVQAESTIETPISTDVETTAPVETLEVPAQDDIAAEAKESRARDEKGRFAAKAGGEQEAPPEPIQDIPQRKAPSSWKPAAQEAFLKASRGEQLTTEEIKMLTDEAERRENDFHKGVSEFKGHAERARAYEQAITPYTQYLQQLGVDAPTAISHLLKTEHTLRTADPYTKAQEFARLASAYGVDLESVINPPEIDPNTQYLMNELNNLRHQQSLWQNQYQQQAQEQAQAELSRFGADKTHLDAVRSDMADLLETGKAKSLEEAYEMAVWMRPDIRTTLLNQQRAEAQKKALELAQTQKAKAAAVSVKGSSPISTGVQPVKGSLREIIAAQFTDS